jgi:filamentous hemagglutinin family protein
LRANPTGGQVTSGTASINTGPGIVTIQQATTSAIINWQDFSIATGETTRFQVPTSLSSTLNRVTGGNISNIYGTLQSNGRVFLINPNGVFIGPTGRIDTASFLASTLNLSDAQYLQNGDLNFSGTSQAGITNQGKIRAKSGDVYLIAAQVNNSGSISAKQGTVGLAAGTKVLLQKSGDQHLFVELGEGSAAQQATGIVNSGKIAAAAAELKAAGGNAYALAINNSGNIAATGVTKINGQVYLTADGANITNSGMISAKQANGNGGTVVVNAHGQKATTKGTFMNSGSIIASGTAAGATGGTVELLGDKVGLTAGLVDVSGDAGGGTVLVGGDEHGANTAVPDADNTYLGPNATIDANAVTSGNGGKVILWGNSTTQAYGNISVRGGAQSGDGGFVETSGAQLQALTAPDLAAPNGKGGTWLLDPLTVLIDDQVADSGFTYPPFSITSGNITVNQSTLLTALQSGSLQIDASQSAFAGAGTITWTQTGGTAFDISSLTSNPTLELDAPISINLSGIKIYSSNGSGGLYLTLNNSSLSSGTVGITNSTINLNGANMSVIANTSFTSSGSDLTAGAIAVTSPSINISGSQLTTTQAYYGGGDGLSLFAGTSGSNATINISNSTITGPSMSIGDFFAFGNPGSQVSINNSTINLLEGSNPPGTSELYINGETTSGSGPSVDISNNSKIIADSGQIYIDSNGVINIGNSTITGPNINIGNNDYYTSEVNISASTLNLVAAANGSGGYQLNINGVAAVAGDAGVSITSNSSITDTTDGEVYINGTGLLSPGSDSIGVLVNNSTFTIGSSTSATGASLDIEGYSDGGSTYLAANPTFANNSYGVKINGSTFNSYAGDTIDISGKSYAANNLNTYGTYINGSNLTANSSDPLYGGKLEVDGDVGSEVFYGSSGEANDVYGVFTLGSAKLTASGGRTDIFILGNTYDASAYDNGNSSVQVINSAIDLTDGTTVTASGDGKISDGRGAISIDGLAGTADASRSNTNEADSVGVWIHANGGASPSVTDNGSIVGIGGTAGNVTAPHAVSIGVALGDLGSAPVSVTSNGGVIGLSGLGGTISDVPGATTFTGLDAGLDLRYSTVSTTTGFVIMGGFAGIVSGNLPGGSSVDSAGVKLVSSKISTNTSGPGLSVTYPAGTSDNISYGGGTISLPPSIALYGTNGGIDFNNNLFVPGSGGYAVEEDANSSLISANLVMGNVYGQLSNLVPTSVLNQILSNTKFQNAISNLNNLISQYNVTLTPIGQISLTSAGNQIANLDSVLVGSGGFNFYDNSSVTVDPIGGNDNSASSFGDVNAPANGPVTITTTGNLILTNTSPLTGATSSTPVIWTSGAGNNIVLNVENGYFINEAGSDALVGVNGAYYAISVQSPRYAFLGGLDPTAYYNSFYQPGVTPLTGNSIFYASALGDQYYPDGPGDPNNPSRFVTNALNSIAPISLPLPISGAGVIGGAGGVAPPKDHAEEVALRERLTRLYGAARANALLTIIHEDSKDGSTVNTGTVLNKWAANTGLSKIVHVAESARIYDGLSQPYSGDSLIYNQFQEVNNPQSLDEMSRAAFGTRTVKPGAGH